MFSSRIDKNTKYEDITRDTLIKIQKDKINNEINTKLMIMILIVFIA